MIISTAHKPALCRRHLRSTHKSPWSGHRGLPILRKEDPSVPPQLAVVVGLGHNQGSTSIPGTLSRSVSLPPDSMSLGCPHDASVGMSSAGGATPAQRPRELRGFTPPGSPSPRTALIGVAEESPAPARVRTNSNAQLGPQNSLQDHKERGAVPEAPTCCLFPSFLLPSPLLPSFFPRVHHLLKHLPERNP